jgi:hypothetical protein
MTASFSYLSNNNRLEIRQIMCIHILIDAKRELSYRRQIDNNNRPIIPGGLRIKDNRNIKIYPIAK